MPPQKRSSDTFPSEDEILDFVRESSSPVGKREIVRAFHLSGNDRIRLKATLKKMIEEGQIARSASRLLVVPEGLPPVAVLEVTGTDSDGEVLARPIAWKEDAAPPPIYVAMERRGGAALWPGERILARVRQTREGAYAARIIRRIGAAPDRILGVVEETSHGLQLVPTDRRHKHAYVLRRG
ncbi:MAG: ribonuclease R, partial [Alphaproteobacteria bacterium]